MIAIPITASATDEALKDIKKAQGIAGLLELRLDFIRDINNKNLERLLSGTAKKVIVTDRKNRIGLIREAVRLDADFIDMDISAGKKAIRDIIKAAHRNKTRIIVSFHNFKKTDKREILKRYSLIKKLCPDIIKIASFADSIDNNLIIFSLIKRAKKENKRIIALCMGEKGGISRIISPFIGSEWTYGSLKHGKESAPGQIPADMLKSLYRIDRLKKPKIFGLVGNPVRHSKGIIIHNKAFAKLKLDRVYVNFLVDNLKSFIDNYKPIISGLSVTIPFKRDIIRYLDDIDPVAKKIGAVNTVIKRDGKLIGYNTDVTGAIKAIESKTSIKGRRVLM
ncbi:type I 3-dehydroquinate dehydratase, partial [Candidatus Woesearchaeota archaeon]|nr:type I 3-dehydroquinate dehydratase [Candidatus Woesearchaeota archaeon]